METASSSAAGSTTWNQDAAAQMSWACRFCTLVNAPGQLTCAGCGSESPSGQQHQSRMLARLPNFVQRPLATIGKALDSVLAPSVVVNPQPYHRQHFVNGQQNRLWYDPRSPSRSPSPPPVPAAVPMNDTTFDMPVLPFHEEESRSCEEREREDEVVAESLVQAAIEKCRRTTNGGKHHAFRDDEFLATQSSIGDLSAARDTARYGSNPNQHAIPNVVWLRPSKIFTKDGRSYPWAVFNDPQPTDIEQGFLGNCWLVSALALVAERPDLLMRIVLTRSYSLYGVYAMRVCVHGAWHVLLLDDKLPCREDTHSLIFARASKNQLWVSLIEKALAKRLGGYAQLRAGRTHDGLAMLTGEPVEQLFTQRPGADPNLLWAQLLSAREAGFLMGCSCGAGDSRVDEEEYRKKGLTARHAYSILDVREWPEGPERLIKLRNPWGQHVWKGAWSPNWTGWPPELAVQLNSNLQSGTFWMGWSDFLAHFDAVDVAKPRSHCGWTELRIAWTLASDWTKSQNHFIWLEIPKPSECAFALFQEGTRVALDHTDLMLAVFEWDASTGRVGRLVTRTDRRTGLYVSTGDVFMRAGSFVAVAYSLHCFGNESHAPVVRLVVHSNSRIKGTLVTAPSTVYRDGLFRIVDKEGQDVEDDPMSTASHTRWRFLTRNFMGFLVVVENQHRRHYLHAQSSAADSSNVVSTLGVLDRVVSVPPRSKMIVNVLSQLEPSAPFEVKHRLMTRLAYTAHLSDWSALQRQQPHVSPQLVEALHGAASIYPL